jgi:phage baseplate assembly protein W
MDSLLTPIDLTKYGLQRTSSIKEAIDAFLNLLLSTTCGESPIDPQFGFIFNNMRFEIFNEREGVVYNSLPSEEVDEDDLYSKKISGNSKNFNTFATDLRAAIMKYEPRLENVAATMSYIREERKVYVTVTGNISETKEKYQYETILNIWN